MPPRNVQVIDLEVDNRIGQGEGVTFRYADTQTNRDDPTIGPKQGRWFPDRQAVLDTEEAVHAELRSAVLGLFGLEWAQARRDSRPFPINRVRIRTDIGDDGYAVIDFKVVP